jgi:translation initiation factor IF-2
MLAHGLDAELADELRANPNKPAVASVIESHLDPGRGPVVTVLVEEGTLSVGDTIVAGPAWGHVRAMFDENGFQVSKAGPSVPVEVLGLDDVPLAGDELRVAPSDKVARVVAEARQQRRKLAQQRHPTTLGGGARLEDIFAMVQRGEVATLNLIVKADVQGSLEALTDALRKLDSEHEEVRLSFVLRGVGGISESDINLAIASKAVIIGFNVRADVGARKLAENNGVDIRYYNIIYDAVDEMKAAMTGMLAPEQREEVIGTAEIRTVFVASKIGTVAGSMVTSGLVRRGARYRLLRENVVVHTGEIESVRRLKDDVREVKEGFECGIKLKNYNDIAEGDQLEFFEIKEVARTL